VISVISSTGSTSRLMRLSSPSFSSLWMKSRRSLYATPPPCCCPAVLLVSPGLRSRSERHTLARRATAKERLRRQRGFARLENRAGVVQWQNRSFPSFGRGFDSHRPLQNRWKQITYGNLSSRRIGSGDWQRV